MADYRVAQRARELQEEAARGPSHTAAKRGDVDLSAEKYGTTKGKGLGKMAGSMAGMPKQMAGESPAAYGRRLAAWRRKKREGMTGADAATALGAR